MPSSRRQDAVQNRARVLQVATEVLTQGRVVRSIREIAELAGVSSATAYRHFPNRTALAVAVVREQLGALHGLVNRTEPDEFRWLLQSVLACQAAMRPLVTLLDELPRAEREWSEHQTLRALVAPFERCREAGLVRPGVEFADVRRAFIMLDAVIVAAAEDERAHAAARATEVILDGLFLPTAPRPTTPCPRGDQTVASAKATLY